MRALVSRWKRTGNTLALTWTLISLGLVAMLWVSGFRAWPVYLVVVPSSVVAVLLWIGAVRTRRRETSAGKPEPAD